jgi:acetylornithine deacetylase
VTSVLSDRDLLARIVGFDTTSHRSNLPLADFICDYIDRPGVRVYRNTSTDEPKANLCIAIGPESDPNDRDGLVLSGHMDVVPALEPDWRSDPFVLTERDGGLYGRGSADMKGFVALAVNAVARVDPHKLKCPIVLILTYDEELGTLGAQHFRETWTGPEVLPRHAIIGEPTSLRVVRLHKGHLRACLTFSGIGAHSGYPHLGRSAIEPAGRAIVALTRLRQELEAERPAHSEYFGEVPYVALNIAQISGGVAINIVPDRCQIDVGARLLPEMSAEPLFDRIRLALESELAASEFVLQHVNESPPLLVDESAPIYRAACERMNQTATFSVSYATDAGWLQYLDLDCIIWGPGTIEVAHKPNEFMPIAEFAEGREHLDHIVHEFTSS